MSPATETQTARDPEAALLSTIARLDSAARFLGSEFFVARLLEGVRLTAVELSSPWVDRKAAAAYVQCSTSEIDRAANLNVITRYPRGTTPMFLKSDIDKAILEGKWPKNGK